MAVLQDNQWIPFKMNLGKPRATPVVFSRTNSEKVPSSHQILNYISAKEPQNFTSALIAQAIDTKQM